MLNKIKKIKVIRKKTFFTIFEMVGAFIFLYLIILPVFPEIKYRFLEKKVDTKNIPELKKEMKNIRQDVDFVESKEFDVSSDRLIIKKIGVNIPIVVSQDSGYGLSKGAWLDPESSRPDRSGNTVITGHRFKYLPPSNFTFYLLHKLEAGDLITVLWEDEYYFYQVKETKIVEPDDLSVLEQGREKLLTLYTCNPIYSQKNRLVVVSELLNDELLLE